MGNATDMTVDAVIASHATRTPLVDTLHSAHVEIVRLRDEVERLRGLLEEADLCPQCGLEDGWCECCPECGSDNKHRCGCQDEEGDGDDDTKCPDCNGSGEGPADGTRCRSCGGWGEQMPARRERTEDDYARWDR